MVVISDSELRAFTCDTKTGKTLATIPFTSPNWSLRLNAGGTLQASIPCYSEEAQSVNIRELTQGFRRSFGIAFGDQILECGPILRRNYDGATGMLDITAAGLWEIFNHRKLLNSRALDPSYAQSVTSSHVEFGPASLGSIAAEIVRVSMRDNYYGAGELNIVLPPFEAGTERRTYWGYDLHWQGAALKALTEIEEGVDIRFRPRFMESEPTRVEWVMETGTNARPWLQQIGEPHYWNAAAEESGVTVSGYEDDSTGLAMRDWTPGQGQERDMPLGQATDRRLADLGWPWLESEHSEKQEADLGRLNSRARRNVEDSGNPSGLLSASVRADYPPYLGTYQPGDLARIVVPDDHPTLDPGPRDVRIMAIDGSDTKDVKLTLQGITGSVDGSPVGEGETVAEPPAALYPSASTFPSHSTFPA